MLMKNHLLARKMLISANDFLVVQEFVRFIITLPFLYCYLSIIPIIRLMIFNISGDHININKFSRPQNVSCLVFFVVHNERPHRTGFIAFYNLTLSITVVCIFGCTVNDVLDEGICELITSLKDLMYAMSEDYNMLSPQTLFAFLNTIISDADIVRNLFASDNGSLLFNRLQKTLQETLLKEMLDNDIKMSVPPEQYPLISDFVAGGMVSVYYEWITNPNGITLDDMARTLTTLIISGVHAFA